MEEKKSKREREVSRGTFLSLSPIYSLIKKISIKHDNILMMLSGVLMRDIIIFVEFDLFDIFNKTISSTNNTSAIVTQ